MKTVDLEEPFRLSRDFWLAYALLGVPVLCFTQPWSWELPLLSQVAGLVFLPFAAAIACYCPILFVLSIGRGSSKEKKIGLAFVAATTSATLFLGLVWLIYDFGNVPSRFGATAVIIANFVFVFFQTKKPDERPQ